MRDLNNPTSNLILDIQNQNSPLSWRIRRVLAHIDGHYNGKINLRDTALIIGINPNYLCRKFKREVGISFYKYILRLRIQRAGRLLAESNKNVKEISYEVGFSRPEIFSKGFKKMLGYSPSRYRTINPSMNTSFDILEGKAARNGQPVLINEDIFNITSWKPMG